MKLNEKNYRLDNSGHITRRFLLVSYVGILLSYVGYNYDPKFIHSYLVCYLFFTTLSLGGLFFVLAHHIFGADWSVSIRRFGENLMVILPLMLFLSLPIVLNFDRIYEWTDPLPEKNKQTKISAKHDSYSHTHNDSGSHSHSNYEKNNHHVSTHAGHVHDKADKHGHNFWEYHPTMLSKSSYLNKDFFFARMIFYFVVWFGLVAKLYRLSLNQRTEEDKIKMRRVSAVGIALFALTGSFFAFDSMMTLDPTWYSTMFGVYIFAGAFLSAVALILLVSLYLRSKGIFVDEINEKHYSNLGKICFSFTVFWAYIGGFQYYIIWYSNIGEEINWFLQRWEGPWKYVSYTLIFGHFVIPFFTLIFFRLKRNKAVLAVIGSLILMMHWLDMYWVVMPNYFRVEEAAVTSLLSWTDFSLLLAMGGLFMAIYWRLFKTVPIAPIHDTDYAQSISKEES
tara:strand:+ start:2817 stop:4169 length:1353 start_codon:yes stop_codon:yes gene_type:complete